MVLGVGVLAQGSVSAFHQGLPSIAPALQSNFHLSLVATGVLLTSVGVGVALTLVAWGMAADHFGERLVLGVGLLGAGLALTAAAYAPSYPAILAALLLAGMLGSVANTASGRAVMAWFARSERGTALGIRQMATPLGGAVAAGTLPLILFRFGLPACLLALAALCVMAALASTIWLRPAPSLREASTQSGRSPLRDRRIWRLALGGSLIVAGQLSFITYIVFFLNQHRGLTLGTAAAVLAAVQLTGAAGRVGVGRLSDRVGHRIGLLRWVAISSGFALGAVGLLTEAPLALLVPVLVAAGFLSMVSNGLAFTATGEIAGTARAGTAMGFQNTLLFISGVVAPVAFAAVVSTAGWRIGFLVVGGLGLAGWWVLRPLEPLERLGWETLPSPAR